MESALTTFVLMAGVIIVAGVFLARCADRIATVTGMGHSLAGLVLLAAATSLPELSIGWNSVQLGAPDLAAGDVFGSCLINLLILSLLDLMTRSRGKALSRAAAAHALAATASVLMVAVALLAMLIGWNWTIWRFGPGSVMIVMVYLFSIRLIYFDQQSDRDGKPDEHTPGLSLRAAVIGYVVGAAAILLAAPRLSRTAGQLAEQTGLGASFFGTVFIATVTSLPEAVTTLAAIRLGRPGMGIANILGSNAFNIVILAFVDAATPGSLLAEISATHTVTAASVILVTAVATISLLYRAEKRWWLIEPDAVLVALLVLAALAVVYYL